MSRFRPPTIREQGGILAYLDSTASQRNGTGGEVFKQYARDYLDGIISKAALARKMGVEDTRTIDYWLTLLEEEPHVT